MKYAWHLLPPRLSTNGSIVDIAKLILLKESEKMETKF